MIFVTILGLFLAPFRDKIAATSDQMRFWPENALKCVCGGAPDPAGGAYSAPPALPTYSRRVVPACYRRDREDALYKCTDLLTYYTI